MKAIPFYKKYKTTEPVGTLCLCNWGGLEILDIIYGIDDYVIACFNFGTGRQQIRRHKVMTAPSGKTYIKKQGKRYYLNEIMRY